MAKYKHVGTQPLTYGAGRPDQQIQPGTEFEMPADVSPEQEAFWLKLGAVVKLDTKKPKE